MTEIGLILWVIIQLGVIGILWSIPILFWGKVLIVGVEGLYTLKLIK